MVDVLGRPSCVGFSSLGACFFYVFAVLAAQLARVGRASRCSSVHFSVGAPGVHVMLFCEGILFYVFVADSLVGLELRRGPLMVIHENLTLVPDLFSFRLVAILAWTSGGGG